MSDIAIKVENLSKYYNLGVINSGTLSRDLQSWLWKKMGKEDPNRKIGAHEDSADGFWALKDLSFEIKKGECVGIIGKNGAGKSTLLKMLSQISVPTEGRIYINGKVASLLEVGTGFNPELTGRENIYMNGAILGMKKREIDAKIDEIISFSEIERHIDTPVKRYSSGMYVRLAFAVAAHLDSDILIADEVLAVGDAAFQKKALGKMNELSSGQGRTVFFVSHNMGAVKQLCQRGIVLEKGKLVRNDSDINESVAWYLGINAMKENHIMEWRNDGSFYDINFCPKSMYICDMSGNIVKGSLDYNRAYKLCLEVNIEDPINNVAFWLPIFVAGTYTIIGDFHVSDFKYTNGKNIYTFLIPDKSLLPNRYVVSIGASIKNTKWILKEDEFNVSINFCVENDSDIVFKEIAENG